MQRHHVGPIAEGDGGIGMHLEEQPIHAHCHRRPGQGGHKFPLAAGGGALAAGLLHGVGGIKDHRAAQGLHLGQAAVVHHQGVVAKAAAPFCQPEAATSRIQA